jgi:hypothetical protein
MSYRAKGKPIKIVGTGKMMIYTSNTSSVVTRVSLSYLYYFMENANESFIFLGYLLKLYKSLYIQYIEN